MSKIIYKTVFRDPETGSVNSECIGVTDEDGYARQEEAWKEYTSNVTMEILVELSDYNALTLAEKIIEMHKKEAEDEYWNPPEPTVMII